MVAAFRHFLDEIGLRGAGDIDDGRRGEFDGSPSRRIEQTISSAPAKVDRKFEQPVIAVVHASSHVEPFSLDSKSHAPPRAAFALNALQNVVRAHGIGEERFMSSLCLPDQILIEAQKLWMDVR